MNGRTPFKPRSIARKRKRKRKKRQHGNMRRKGTKVSEGRTVVLNSVSFSGFRKGPEAGKSPQRTLTTAHEGRRERSLGRPVAKKVKKTGNVTSVSGRKIKRRRAQGGCPGTKRRRRTWQAAKSKGEPQAGKDPLISEWGNPAGGRPVTFA